MKDTEKEIRPWSLWTDLAFLNWITPLCCCCGIHLAAKLYVLAATKGNPPTFPAREGGEAVTKVGGPSLVHQICVFALPQSMRRLMDYLGRMAKGEAHLMLLTYLLCELFRLLKKFSFWSMSAPEFSSIQRECDYEVVLVLLSGK